MSINNDLNEFLKAIFVYFEKEPNEIVYSTYVIGLNDLNVNWKELFVDVTRKFNFMPKVAQIRQMVTHKPDITLRDKANLLIDRVREHVKKYGWNNQNEFIKNSFDDEKELVRCLGGWQKTCETDFSQSYKLHSMRELAEIIVKNDNFNERLNESEMLDSKSMYSTIFGNSETKKLN